MSKILKNDSGGDIILSDVGITIVDASQYTIVQSEYLRFAKSDDVIVYIAMGVSGLVVNDGSVDLSISDGTDLIKGIFQKHRIIGDTDDTLIGNIDDKLKVTGLVFSEEGGFEVKPELSHQAFLNLVLCEIRAITRQLRILNQQTSVISDYEYDDLDDEPGSDNL
jgi:hypothetical protein